MPAVLTTILQRQRARQRRGRCGPSPIHRSCDKRIARALDRQPGMRVDVLRAGRSRDGDPEESRRNGHGHDGPKSAIASDARSDPSRVHTPTLTRATSAADPRRDQHQRTEARGFGDGFGDSPHSGLTAAQRQDEIETHQPRTVSGIRVRGERRDSNPRPPGPQPGALPAELRPPGRLNVAAGRLVKGKRRCERAQLR